MPFCPQCGVENPSSARFCDQCGALLVPVPAQGQATAPAIPIPPPAPAAPSNAHAGPTLVAGPHSCPQCGMSVIPGEAFCDNCGAALLGAPRAAPAAPAPSLPFGGVPAQANYPAPQPVAPVPPRPAVPQAPPPRPAAPIPPPQPAAPMPPPPPPRLVLAPACLIVRSNGNRLALPAHNEAVIGRSDPVSNFFPEVDLSTYDAVSNGVGRRHARLFVQSGQVCIEDLDSTNGTFRNGARLAPRQPIPLANGDELRLGKLVLSIQL